MEITSQANATEIVHLAPNAELNVTGVSYDNAQIEVIGADIILINAANGGKVIFPGLGLILFDDAQAPVIKFDGQTISPKMFGDKIGVVSSVTANDYVSFTSLDIVDEAPEEKKETDQKSQVSEEAVQELEEQNQNLQQEVESLLQSQEEAEFLLSSVISENATLQGANVESEDPLEAKAHDFDEVTDVGVPPQEENVFTSDSSSSSSSSSSSTDDATVDDVLSSVANFSFEAYLLQPGATETTEDFDFGSGEVSTFVVRGGGGDADATFDPDNDVQLSSEDLNYSTRTDDIVIYADDEDLFDDDNLTRSIEIDSTLPDGFEVSSAVISGLPSGFEIIGAVDNGDGTYTLDLSDAALTSRGSIQFDLKYAIPETQSFDMEISVTAVFDTSSNYTQPDSTTQTFVLTQSVEQKDVTDSSDLNYTDDDGNLVWVLTNEANENTISSGSGDDYISGSGGVDTIDGNAGDDTIYGNDGDDIIDGGDGSDSIFGGLGDDIINGGSGTDTVSYESRTEDISLDLSTVDDDGYTTVTIGTDGEEDLIGEVENITGGSGDDTLTGDAEDNYIIGGAGDDVLDGGTGDDTLDGGDGTDSVSFISGTSGLTVDLGTGGTINVGNGDKTLLNIESITATNFDDTITAVGGDNVLNGADGDDVFITDGDGTDTFDGGFLGSDTSILDRIDYSTSTNGITLDLSLAADADGFHSVSVGGTTDLVQNFEIYYGSDNAADTITGGADDEEIRGNGGDDILSGGDGDDVIYGGAGEDTLDGGSGGETDGDILDFSDLTTAVTLNLTSPSAGTAVSSGDTDTFSNFESYVLTSEDDTINESVGADIVDGGDGVDEITYDARSGVYIEVDLSASDLTIDVRDSSTDGLLEQDVLTSVESVVGSSGDDSFIDGSDDNTIDGGAGSDTLTYASDSTAISFNMNLTTGGFFTVTQGSESDLIARIENIVGSSSGDTMQGNDSSNNFSGGGGNDTIIASEGGDTYTGGAGTDFVRYDSLVGLNSVTVDLSSGADLDLGDVGSDSSDFSDTFTDDIESVSGTAGDDTITGNSLDNVIYDLGGDDVLDGGAGENTVNYSLLAGTGVDVDLAAGTADDDSGSGSLDSLSNFQNIVGSEQDDTLSGDTGVNQIDGGDGADVISGLDGDDVLNGGDGDDEITGGAGDDIIDGGDGTDRVFYNDTVTGVTVDLDAGTATDGYGDTDTLSNIEAVTGSAGDDNITAGEDTAEIDAEGGNDTIVSNIGSGSGRVANIDGGADTDTIDYTSSSAISGASINGTIANITLSGNTDIVLNVEGFQLGAAGDTFSIDTNAISSNLSEFDGNGGTDSITVTDGSAGDLTDADIDGDTLAGIFLDIETFDFRSTDLTGGDTFDLTGANVSAMTDSDDDLSILIDGVNITFADFSLDAGGVSFVGTGTTRTADFGGGVTLTVTSDV